MYSLKIANVDYEKSYALPPYKALLNSNSPPYSNEIPKGGSDLGRQTLPKSWKERRNFEISDCTKIPVEEMARQITLIDWNIYKSIKVDEFITYACDSKLKHIKATSVAKFTKQFNTICFWAISVILKFLSVKRRAEAISYFIKLAKKLYELNDVHSEFAVISALKSAPVYRLIKTWNFVPKKHKYQMEKLSELFSESDNHANLRQHLNTIRLPCIPYTGFFLTDLVYLNNIRENNSPSTKFTNSYNHETPTSIHRTNLNNGHQHHESSRPDPCYAESARQSKINNILRMLAEYQASDYSFIAYDASIQAYLADQSYGDELQKTIEDTNFRASQFLEPPNGALTYNGTSNTTANNNNTTLSKDRPSPLALKETSSNKGGLPNKYTRIRTSNGSGDTPPSPILTSFRSIVNHKPLPTPPPVIINNGDDPHRTNGTAVNGKSEPPQGYGCFPSFMNGARRSFNSSKGYSSSPSYNSDEDDDTHDRVRGGDTFSNRFLSPASARSSNRRKNSRDLEQQNFAAAVMPELGHRKAKSLGTTDDLNFLTKSRHVPRDRISVSSVSSEVKRRNGLSNRAMGHLSTLLQHLASFQTKKPPSLLVSDRSSPFTPQITTQNSPTLENNKSILLPSIASTTAYRLKHEDLFKPPTTRTDAYRPKMGAGGLANGTDLISNGWGGKVSQSPENKDSLRECVEVCSSKTELIPRCETLTQGPPDVDRGCKKWRKSPYVAPRAPISRPAIKNSLNGSTGINDRDLFVDGLEAGGISKRYTRIIVLSKGDEAITDKVDQQPVRCTRSQSPACQKLLHLQSISTNGPTINGCVTRAADSKCDLIVLDTKLPPRIITRAMK